MNRTIYLLLENGKIFQGKSFGAEGEVTAEVVFTTGMTGYLETLTDQSYFGQMVVQTFPLIGNYGVISPDFESPEIEPSAYIVKNFCDLPSNFRCEGDIDTWLRQRGVVGLYDIDTRALTRVIRENGVMNGKITFAPEKEDLEKIRQYRISDAVKNVSVMEKYEVKAPNGKYKVALLDFGLKKNIIRELVKYGCDVTVFPYDTTAEEISALAPDGIMLSNGPGDPAENTGVIENLKEMCALRIPIFGICLGHQLLALANGCQTEKLKYGHRGANQPVKDLVSGRVYVTSQNHGYAVVPNSIKNGARELFRNVNDGTNEGILYENFPAFTVQFHPEACAGPQDTDGLFGRFTAMMEGK